MNVPRVAIAGCGAVTAHGLGMEPLERAVMTNAGGLRESPRLVQGRRSPNVTGWVPDEVMAQLRARDPEQGDARAFLLADAAMREALEGTGSLRGASAVTARRRGLVLSTTKAEVTVLERVVCGECCSRAAQRHLLPALLASDLAAAHGIAGPVRSVSVACVSGLLALEQGVHMIQDDRVDLVCVVGVDLLSDFVLSGFTALRSLDPGGCRPFDVDRKGLSLGEGAGAAVLVRRADAPPAALVVAGWGSSNDANHLTGPSRDGAGLALAMGRALRRAGVEAGQVDLVHMHGTGTAYNDLMEAMALRRVFGAQVPPFCSSKGLVGHTLGAAGLLETLICLAAARRQWLPGTPGLRTRDPAVPESVVAAPRPASGLRHLLKVNAGFAGTNAALVLEWEGAGGPP